jgi:hypothetical protein
MQGMVAASSTGQEQNVRLIFQRLESGELHRRNRGKSLHTDFSRRFHN